MITIKKGESYTKYLQLQYADTRDPLDLTGVSAYCQMRDVPGGTLLATATCTTDAQTGGIWAAFSATQTDALPVGECGFDIWIVENNRQHPIYTTRCKIIDAYTEIGA